MRTRKRRLLGLLRAYRAAAAAMPDAVVVVDRNSQRVLWFNKAATPPARPAAIRSHRARRSSTALQPLPMAHWLAAGRNAEPMIDVALAGGPGRCASACA